MKKIYLSGSIEFQVDPYSWRNQMYKELSSLFEVIIPKCADIPYPKIDNKYKEFTYEKFIIPDITDVLRSEHVFVKIDKGVLKGSGTTSELCFASFYKKDIIYILSDDLTENDISGWMLGCLYKAKQVKTIEEAIEVYKKERI
jgi:hypothetical protein